MSRGVRATVAFPNAEVCPVATLVADAGGSIVSASTSVAADGRPSVTEFVLRADRVPEGPGFEQLFSRGSTHLVRRSHDGAGECPCECLGAAGCPVDRYGVADGRLSLTFYASDYDQLRAVVGSLRERWPAVEVRRVVPSPSSNPTAETVLVDRGKLTERQREVLATAYRMGYFERPRRANATEVAAALGIDPSTLTEHLSVALGKLLDDVLDPGAGG